MKNYENDISLECHHGTLYLVSSNSTAVTYILNLKELNLLKTLLTFSPNFFITSLNLFMVKCK